MERLRCRVWAPGTTDRKVAMAPFSWLEMPPLPRHSVDSLLLMELRKWPGPSRAADLTRCQCGVPRASDSPTPPRGRPRGHQWTCWP